MSIQTGEVPRSGQSLPVEAVVAESQIKEMGLKENSVKKSWAAVASRPSLSQFNYEISMVEGRTVVQVPPEILEDAPPLWEDFLVGRFASSAPHVAKIHVIVNKIWTLGDRSIKIDVFSINETSVKFRICNASVRQHVLRRGMWNICEIPMIVSKWTPIVEDAQPEIKSMPMWVKIKNVPHSLFSWKGLSFLASPIGVPLRLHQETVLVTNFEEAKFFVDINLSQELPGFYYFDLNGEEICVEYEYPWLPKRCAICKKWGHSEAECLANLGRTVSAAKVIQSIGTTKAALVEVAVSEERPVPRQLSAIQEKHETTESKVGAEMAVEVVEGRVEPMINQEREDGEIPTSPQVIAVEDGEGEWSTIPGSGGKSATNQSHELIYGQVRISSPSRYEVLRYTDEEGDNVDKEEAAVAEAKENGDVSNETTLVNETSVSVEEMSTRVPPPRLSKSSHRFVPASSQTAKKPTLGDSKKRPHRKH